MAVLLNLAAIAFGAAAIVYREDHHWKMLSCGFLAAALFVWSAHLYPSTKDYGDDCERYSKFAESC